MENASKALIIAGAILLSILIISLGIMIFNQAQGVVNSDSMDAVEMQQFNQKFANYEGNRVKGSKVKSLLQEIVTSNLAQEDENRKISVNGSASISLDKNATNITGITVNTGSTYEVVCNYSPDGATKGLITSITINPAS